MSQYGRGVIAGLRDPECLTLALWELGFEVEVHETPQRLVGYRGDLRAETAHIIIRRKHIGRSSNDVGFYVKADGTIEAVISEYDAHRFNAAWLGQLTKVTGIHRGLRDAKIRGRRAVRMKHEVSGKDMMRVFV